MYLVTEVEMYAFDPESIPDCRMYVDGIKRVLQSGFYFSYNADLTSSQQRA